MTDEQMNGPSKDLVTEAFAVLEQTSDNPAARSTTLADWSARSPEHADALAVAEAEIALFAKLQNPQPQGLERLRIGLGTIAAQAGERPLQIAAASLALAALLTLPLSIYWPPASPEVAQIDSEPIAHVSAKPSMARHATARGEQTSVVLEDGSTVWLNWDSEIEVSFVEAERHVDLTRGSAIFSVAEDLDRPFIVHAGDAVARVLGTEFAVHKHDAERVVFEVKEGLVAINAAEGRETVQLAKAEAVTFQGGGLGEVRKASVSSIGAWRDGLLVFEESPLREVLEELGHYTTTQLRIIDLEEPERPVTGTFFIDDADGALESLKAVFDLETELDRDGVLSVQSNPL